SRQIFSVFRRFTPLVEGLSLDEAFLDVTGSQALFGDGRTIAARIREEIRAETGLTASAGVAPSKFVAKIASDMDKPDGLFVVEPGEVAAFLAPLPIARMWGVGPKAAAGLATRGYRTFSDLVAAGPAVLERELGSWGASVFRLAQGEDPREVIADREAKSLGSEQTFEQDLRRPEDLARALLGQSATVAGRLVVAGLAGSVVAVKLKYADFQVRTRQARSPEPIQDTESIHRMAKELLQRFPRRPMGIRLTGVSVSDLVPDDTPAGLFPDAATLRRKALEKTVSDLSKRLGKQVVTRASLLGTRRDRGASDGD
ncbi:MAG: DNA polymerase IV, partial [Myxococcales bacterium]|nr:DNA polymerase IV [Myxococcales bacterium]